MAYQLVDDWLDYVGDGDVMGKNPGDDLAEGKVTLPLIHTMTNGHGNQPDVVRRAIDTRSAVDFHDVAHAVQRSAASPTRRSGLSKRPISPRRRFSRCLRAAIETPWKHWRWWRFRGWLDAPARATPAVVARRHLPDLQ